jgi:anaerobic selenocysteine-containing dehydrogenase
MSPTWGTNVRPMASDDTVSNPAPDVVKRLKAIRARDGEVVVIDPRRTETAAMASAHHFVKPGTDALVLLALLHVIFAERLERLGALGDFTDGLDDVRAMAASWSPERVAPLTGVAADTIRSIARDFAAAPALSRTDALACRCRSLVRCPAG